MFGQRFLRAAARSMQARQQRPQQSQQPPNSQPGGAVLSVDPKRLAASLNVKGKKP